ncbi:ubiquitin-conjugating enzyme/RWD-like protein [Russula dissimulans]|nr:ubiquitin-conjugating enzyme/RWD-like protein [Russula dissimulans]
MSDSKICRMTKKIACCNDDNSTNIHIELIDISLFHLRGSFEDPRDSPYEGGHFELDIVVPDLYPFSPLEMKFITKVYHPNVSPVTGAISLSILKGQWSPALTLRTTLISLQSFLCSPEPTDPEDAEVANLYMTARKAFEDTARNWTRMYAKRSA